MDWLITFLKHIAVARSAVLALFAATSAMYFAPIWYPEYAQPISSEWANLLLGVLVLCGALIIFWCAEYLFGLLKNPIDNLNNYLLMRSLSKVETHLMMTMASNPHSSIFIEDINRIEGCSKNEYLFEARNLVDKELARMSINRRSIWMTDKGIKCAHKLQKQT